eukprot:scaffold208756_cov46-Attheya_sp.AAC.1
MMVLGYVPLKGIQPSVLLPYSGQVQQIRREEMILQTFLMTPRAIMFRWSNNTSESMMQASEYPPGSLNEIVVSLLRISTCRIGQQDRRLRNKLETIMARGKWKSTSHSRKTQPPSPIQQQQ